MKNISIKRALVAGIMLLLASSLTASKVSYKQELAQGAHIFQRCSVCHGLHAEKHALGKSEVIARFSERRIIRALKEYRAAIEHDSDAMIMNAQAKHLSNGQIHSVALYIESMHKKM